MVSDIPAGDGNIEKLFLQCTYVGLNNGRPFSLSAGIRMRSESEAWVPWDCGGGGEEGGWGRRGGGNGGGEGH